MIDPADLKRPMIRFYGCCRCQEYHGEGEALYDAHLGFQSKHGWQTMRADQWDDGAARRAALHRQREDERARRDRQEVTS